MNDIAEISRLRKAGKEDEAGRIIFESVPPALRPGWAGEVLALVARSLGVNEDCVNQVIAVARDATHWHRGHAVFDLARSRWLEQYKLHGKTKVWERSRDSRAMYLAEIVAKITYNATSPDMPFDEDAGWYIAGCAWFALSEDNLAETDLNAILLRHVQ